MVVSVRFVKVGNKSCNCNFFGFNLIFSEKYDFFRLFKELFILLLSSVLSTFDDFHAADGVPTFIADLYITVAQVPAEFGVPAVAVQPAVANVPAAGCETAFAVAHVPAAVSLLLLLSTLLFLMFLLLLARFLMLLAPLLLLSTLLLLIFQPSLLWTFCGTGSCCCLRPLLSTLLLTSLLWLSNLRFLMFLQLLLFLLLLSTLLLPRFVLAVSVPAFAVHPAVAYRSWRTCF